MRKPILFSGLTLSCYRKLHAFLSPIVGGAGAIGYTATQDRSVGETIDDAGIEAKINAKFIAQEDRESFVKVTEDSVQGRVLLTGSVPTRGIKDYVLIILYGKSAGLRGHQ